MKYRSRTDITAQILESANGGAGRTRIMYKAFLSYHQLKEYLAILVANNLLEYNKAGEIYRTTNSCLGCVDAVVLKWLFYAHSLESMCAHFGSKVLYR
jgi:predicted transcriptional regulator